MLLALKAPRLFTDENQNMKPKACAVIPIIIATTIPSKDTLK